MQAEPASSGSGAGRQETAIEAARRLWPKLTWTGDERVALAMGDPSIRLAVQDGLWEAEAMWFWCSDCRATPDEAVGDLRCAVKERCEEILRTVAP